MTARAYTSAELPGITLPGNCGHDRRRARVATRFVIGGYHEEDFEIWDSTGVLVAQSRQIAVLP